MVSLPLSRAVARVEFLETRTHLNAGDLDPSFSSDGRATFALGANEFSAVDVAVQSTGKTITLGDCTDGPLRDKMNVVRYDAAGAVDTTFGGAGTGIASIDYLDIWSETTSCTVRAVAIQSDDKIVITGNITAADYSRLTLTRFTADGLLDPTFGTGGKVALFDNFNDLSVFAEDVVIQADGKIVVGTSVHAADLGHDMDFGLLRYKTNGTLDSSFDGDGKVLVGFGENEWVGGLAIDPIGRIVAVGFSHPSSNLSDRQFAIARLTSNGSLDGSFSGDGKVLSRFTAGTFFSNARDVVIQPSGKIVIVGEVGSAVSADHNAGLFRLNDNGTGDPTFGITNGQTEIDFGGQDLGNAMIVGQTGELFIASSKSLGYTPAAGLTTEMTVACLTPDGKFDPVFGGGDGKVEIPFGATPATSSTGRGLARGPNGTIVIAGGDRLATARFFDRKFATISIGTFQPQMYEQGMQGTSLIIGRAERLSTPTRVFLSAGGQATPPNNFPIRPRDYAETVTVPASPPVINFGNGQTSSTYVDIPANATFVVVSLTPVDDTTVEGDETASFTLLQNAQYDVVAQSSSTLVIRDNDVVAGPTVTSSQFLFETAPHQLTFRFNQQVEASLSAADFQITGPGTIPPFTFAYDNVTNTATLSFSSLLADGNYQARVVGSQVTNASGTPMPADALLNFHVLAGDADRNKTVDFNDLVTLAQNYGQFGKTFSQGNFDYSADGAVDFADLVLLAQRYNTTLVLDALPITAATTLVDATLGGKRKPRETAAAILA